MTVLWTWVCLWFTIHSSTVIYDTERTRVTGESEWVKSEVYAQKEAEHDGSKKLTEECSKRNKTVDLVYHSEFDCQKLDLGEDIQPVYKCTCKSSGYCAMEVPGD